MKSQGLYIDAVNNGLIYPYVDDSLNKRMSKEQFLENLKLPTDEEDDFGAEVPGLAMMLVAGVTPDGVMKKQLLLLFNIMMLLSSTS
jgi:hypothetical protein